MTEIAITPLQPSPAITARKHRRRTSFTARGEPMVWLTGGCVAAAVLMIVFLLAFIVWQGVATFWPAPLVQITQKDGKKLMGEVARTDPQGRTLYKTGNFDLTGEDFTWVDPQNVTSTDKPEWGLVIERTAWGNAYGQIDAVIESGRKTEGAAAAWKRFLEIHGEQRELIRKVHHIEKDQMGEVSAEQNAIRLRLRGLEMKNGLDSPIYRENVAQAEARRGELESQMNGLREQVKKLNDEMAQNRVVIRTIQDKIIPADRSIPDEPMMVSQVVRAYPANQLGTGGKLGVYFSRWSEYLFDEPREANTEGGILPAIIGTVLLTMIMVIFVVPIGVIAAIYLREYAKQGLLVSIVRISVNNLSGVPSIVFGVFGLGFFCYIIGARIDQIFFSTNLPDPTVGKSAMIWASLTLALLTLPVVIVATEEALSAVPKSMREGSYACGASKWQTIRRIVLPRAMPGVMTGMILAIARGAGEVAPLMLVGAVKLAPELPISLQAPFFGSDRSFMHLGFHIFDLGFQSRNSEAAKSMVYTTTLLLIGIVVMLNIAAVFIRSRLRKAYAGGHF